MNWIDWLLIGYLALEMIANVAFIGRERKPITHGTAIGVTIIHAFFIVGIIIW